MIFNNLKSILLDLYPTYGGIQEAPIIDSFESTIGWHSSVIINDRKAIASGTSKDRNTARRIGIAESIERGYFLKWINDPQKSTEFKIDEIPSSSGFACGFNEDSTAFRSLCEGVERWAWSVWIDQGYPITNVRPRNLTILTQYLLKEFDSVDFFYQKILIQINGAVRTLDFGIILAETKDGVFAGSRVTSSYDELWEHAAIECNRNFQIFNKLTPKQDLNKNLDWLHRRILYFGFNKYSAKKQIPNFNKLIPKSNWPVGEVILHKGDQPFSGIFIWRTLCADFIPWHLGPDDRFVY